MNSRYAFLLTSLLFAANLAHPARAADEYERNLNYPKHVGGTHATRSAERKAVRAELSEPGTRRTILEQDGEWNRNVNTPTPVLGTHDSRHEERQQHREEMRGLAFRADARFRRG